MQGAEGLGGAAGIPHGPLATDWQQAAASDAVIQHSWASKCQQWDLAGPRERVPVSPALLEDARRWCPRPGGRTGSGRLDVHPPISAMPFDVIELLTHSCAQIAVVVVGGGHRPWWLNSAAMQRRQQRRMGRNQAASRSLSGADAVRLGAGPRWALESPQIKPSAMKGTTI